MNEVTRILCQIESGEGAAAGQLIPLIYADLRRVAVATLANESPGHTLQPTALVHEAFLRLVDVPNVQAWDGRRHFFSAAAEAMRRILVENARRKKRHKHGGAMQREPLCDVPAEQTSSALDLLALDEALARFSLEDPEKAEIVKLRYFAGLSHDEIAQTLNVSTITVKRHWRFARAWLHRCMEG